MERVEVSLPPPDGAPYYCSVNVPLPKPLFWGRCRNIATHAYVQDEGEGVVFKFLRCDDHKDWG